MKESAYPALAFFISFC
ncbi:hypothetical protein CGLO_13423 [Colletotrichum gloeosporioides Cg-14]|uniref:Uncharacterized protein n=1 Tax=Colletotrichum gloeosporioides (strain Cg-14) TaxID=1237896 RepID=T0L792_COLGC|nr:hypothetical protein CGLO_13423 [Colletotrichum gloeosporioides Cg-14]